MTRIVAVTLSTFFVGLLGCADESGGGPPPIDSGSASMTAPVTMSGPGTPGSTGGSGSGGSTGESSGSTASVFTVLMGSLNDGGGGWALPVSCSVRFHAPGEIEPSSGDETAFTFARPFTVDQFPQSFEIDSEQAGGLVARGDTGFVTAVCDTDGDGLFDDMAGGYFPTLPLAEITVPAPGVDIFVGPL